MSKAEKERMEGQIKRSRSQTDPEAQQLQEGVLQDSSDTQNSDGRVIGEVVVFSGKKSRQPSDAQMKMRSWATGGLVVDGVQNIGDGRTGNSSADSCWNRWRSPTSEPSSDVPTTLQKDSPKTSPAKTTAVRKKSVAPTMLAKTSTSAPQQDGDPSVVDPVEPVEATEVGDVVASNGCEYVVEKEDTPLRGVESTDSSEAPSEAPRLTTSQM